MIEKQLRHMTAAKLRLILIFLMVLLVVGSCAGFLYFRQQLVTYASQVNADNTAAAVSSDTIVQLQKLKAEMSDNQVAITRAEKIVADSKHYQYQTQIINDITSYAEAAGITITGFTFNSDQASAGASTSSPAPITPVGLKSTGATITVDSPVSYKKIMNFLYSIELSLTKMNITSVSLTGAPNNKVTVNPIGIEVYTR